MLRKFEKVDGWMDDEWMDGWRHERMRGWTHGWVGGWKEEGRNEHISDYKVLNPTNFIS